MSTFPTCSREFTNSTRSGPAFPDHTPVGGWRYLGTVQCKGGRSGIMYDVDWYVNTRVKLTKRNVYSYEYAISYGNDGANEYVSAGGQDLESFFKNWQQSLLDLLGIEVEPR